MDKLTKERRELFLEKLITEGIANVLAEQELEQQQQTTAVPPATPGPAPETNAIDPDSSSNPNQPQEVFDVDSMVDKLNILRGSRSFTDPEVYGRLTTFFKNLTEEQQKSLDWILTELGKVVIDATEDEAGLEQQQTSSPPNNSNQAQKTPQQQNSQNVQTSTSPTPNAPVSPSNI